MTSDTPSNVSDSSDGLLGAAEIRLLADRLGIRPTKQRGQNFVIDANTVRRIARTAELSPDDVVLEVGPGLGSLTLALLPYAQRVVAVEIDDDLAAALPAPKRREVADPSGFTRRHGNVIAARSGVVRDGAMDACVYE